MEATATELCLLDQDRGKGGEQVGSSWRLAGLREENVDLMAFSWKYGDLVEAAVLRCLVSFLVEKDRVKALYPSTSLEHSD